MKIFSQSWVIQLEVGQFMTTRGKRVSALQNNELKSMSELVRLSPASPYICLYYFVKMNLDENEAVNLMQKNVPCCLLSLY